MPSMRKRTFRTPCHSSASSRNARVAREWLDAATLTRRLDTDGPIAPEYMRVDLVDTLHREVWGQGFAPPTFSDEVG